MTYILPFKEISTHDVVRAGGKGASLGELTQAGIPVPPGVVVLVSVFDRFIEEAGLHAEIEARLGAANHHDMRSVEDASLILRDVFDAAPMPTDLAEEILSAFDSLGAPVVAVRSSATAEDGHGASWAGELETYLNTSREHVVQRVKQCWSSLFTPRAIFYRREKNLHNHAVGVAVVIQAMIQSEVSGIAFTVHPVTEDRNQMIIEAGYGLGEAIVSGQITPDSYVVSKRDMVIEDVYVAEQVKKLQGVKDKEQFEGITNEWIELGEEGKQQKLNGSQIIMLAEICKKIETHYGFPCDIEWAFAGGQFYITQSRPITTLSQP